MRGELLIGVISLLILVALIEIFLTRKKMRGVHGFIRELLNGNLSKRLYLKGGKGYPGLMTDLSMLASFLQDKVSESDEAKGRLHLILQSIPDGILLLDSKDRIKGVNSSFENLFHLKEASIIGRGIGESVSIPGLGIMNLGAEGPARTETYNSNEDRHLEIISLPFTDPNGKKAGSVVIFRDISAQKKIDLIRRDFVANVSHELKTPVTAIKGYSETLLDGAIENREDTLKFLSTIKFQAERMETLIKDLIMLSRIEFGAVPLEKKPVQVEEIVSQAISLFEEKARAKGIYIKKDIQDSCQEIEADPDRFLQILVNLVDNAIKYTDTGGIIIRSRPAQNGRCAIIVRDTGIGIQKKFISRLGERFFRVDASRSRELGGTGLGLAIVKHLVIAHGWKMMIESDPGKGTVVRLYIP